MSLSIQCSSHPETPSHAHSQIMFHLRRPWPVELTHKTKHHRAVYFEECMSLLNRIFEKDTKPEALAGSTEVTRVRSPRQVSLSSASSAEQ